MCCQGPIYDGPDVGGEVSITSGAGVRMSAVARPGCTLLM